MGIYHPCERRRQHHVHCNDRRDSHAADQQNSFRSTLHRRLPISMRAPIRVRGSGAHHGFGRIGHVKRSSPAYRLFPRPILGARARAATFCTGKRKRPAEADRFFRLGIGVAGLLVRHLWTFVTLAGSLPLLARGLTAALLLPGFLARRLILPAGLVLVGHVVSFHGNVTTTDGSRHRSGNPESAVRVAGAN